MSEEKQPSRPLLDRRTLLRSGAAAALAAPLGVIGAQALPFRAATPAIDFSEFPICRTASDTPPIAGAPRKLKLSWNAGAVCLAPVPIAIEYGFFQKHNLDVELVNYSGSTDQLLEAIATGKSDAGLGMALRWLKPLEQGFDVKIAAGTHGGCMRVLTRTNSGVEKLADLKGKIVAVGDLAGPDKNFFSIQLAKLGIDPNKEVDWRAYPGNLLQPRGRERRGAGVPGVRSARPPLAEGLPVQGGRLQSRWRIPRQELLHPRAARQPGARGAAGCSAPSRKRCWMRRCSPRRTRTRPRNRSSPMRQRRRRWPISKAMARYHTHHHHPVGDVLKRELKGYADDLKTVSVFKPSTDTAKFAEKIYVDVFGV